MFLFCVSFFLFFCYAVQGGSYFEDYVPNPSYSISIFSYPQLCEFLEAGKRLACPLGCPQKVYDVMYSCWLKDAKKRPTFYLLETTDLAELLEEFPVSSL